MTMPNLPPLAGDAVYLTDDSVLDRWFYEPTSDTIALQDASGVWVREPAKNAKDHVARALAEYRKRINA